MNIDFSKITDHQRYKVMKVTRIHAGCGPILAPQSCMSHQHFDPIVCDMQGRNAERNLALPNPTDQQKDAR